jgi:FtsH ternary system domain X6
MATVRAGEAALLARMRTIVAEDDTPCRPMHDVVFPLGNEARAELLAVLGSGLVRSLARRGWRREGGKRLWERHPAPALRVTEAALHSVAGSPETPRTVGDELLVYLAVRAGACPPPPEALLCRLSWPRSGPVDFAPLCTPEGEVVVDALQDDLAAAWAAAEVDKATIAAPAGLAARGEAQAATWAAWTAVAPRRLTGFVLAAAARVPSWRLGAGLDRDAPLAERRAAARAAAAIPRAIADWQRWHQEHRALGFVDDRFAEAQPLLALWQRHAASSQRALAALAAVESL